jgi:hypothetical protein
VGAGVSLWQKFYSEFYICKKKMPMPTKAFITKDKKKKVLKLVHPDLAMASSLSDSADIFFFQCVKYILRGTKKEFDVEDIKEGFKNEKFSQLYKHFVSEGNKSLYKNITVFYTTRFASKIKTIFGKILTQNAAIYLAAGLEYLFAEICELGGNIAMNDKKTRVTNKHMETMIRDDEEFRNLQSIIT